MSQNDPFTLVYSALWDMLCNNSTVAKMARLKNRIRFDTSDRGPVKDKVSARDLPELILVPGSSEPHIQRTSNGSSCVETFEVRVATGDQRVHKVLYPLKWAVYCAFASWATELQALTWNDKAFVRLCKPTSATDGVTDTDLNRGIIGWSTIWACKVEMWFTTSDLQGA